MRKPFSLRFFLPRGAVSFAGTVSVSVGITLMLGVRLGADPISVFIQGLQRSAGVSFTLASIFFNLSMLVIAGLVARRFLGGGTVISGLSIGPLVGLFSLLTSDYSFHLAPLWVRFALIVLSGGFFGFGIALLVSNNFGLSCYDALTMLLCRYVRLPLRWGKIGCDGMMVLLGLWLGGQAGWGTLVIVVIVGPMVGCWLPCCRGIVRRMAVASFRANGGGAG